jgi:hypothetical protein
MRTFAAASIAAASIAVLATVLVAAPARAQYTPAAAQSVPTERRRVEVKDASGRVHYEERVQPVASDRWGNAQGNQNDLAVDGAFAGQTIAVLHLYTGEGFDFELPKRALKEKGFSVYRWLNQPPPPAELRRALAKSCQLWIISDQTPKLTAEHLKAIREFFDSGRGVYIWGDNDPYYADANQVAQALFGTKMLGNVPGDQTVNLWPAPGQHGILPNHLLTTGLHYLYEGITIATIQPNQILRPLLYGHEDNLVAAFYDKDGKRAILDGGFTRLYYKWDTAGTGRYVKNAAAWLVNVERFGTKVAAAAK